MSTTTIDNTQPGSKWEFDEQVTAAFDDMLSRSIPQYEVMRRACSDLACRFATRGTDIVDLGCSRGGAIAELIDRLGCANHFIGCDVSEPMLAAARERFNGFIEMGVVSIENRDLRQSFPACRASVIQAVLTLQFTPIEYRQRIVANIYNALICSAVWACVSIIAQTISTLPVHVIRRSDGEKLYDHPLYKLLAVQPNEYMTAATFRETMLMNALLWGGA